MATASITTAGMNRIRSRSDYALSDGISSVSEELHVQRDADQVVSPVHTHGGISIPSSSRARFPPTRHSSDDEEECEMQMYSTSYAGPHDYVNYTFNMAQMEGYLEKQSIKNPLQWKTRWFVMQQSELLYYQDREQCGVIPLDQVDSVTTAKDYGEGAFQIRTPERKYILRAPSKEVMHNWLFNFQKSIANIISVLLRSTPEHHRWNRLSHSLTRRSFARTSRSISFDQPEIGRMSADSFRTGTNGFLDSGYFSNEWHEEHTNTSPRRSTSPLGYASSCGPRSPVAIFAFDPPFESLHEDLRMEEEEREEEEEKPIVTSRTTSSSNAEDTLMSLKRTSSPPVTTGAWVPRFLRDRQNATAVAPPTSSPPRTTSTRWANRFLDHRMAMSQETMWFDDKVSYIGGGDGHGVTSLKGARSTLEDVCCCVPDMNIHMKNPSQYAKHALYALYDGHGGVRAAQYAHDKLVPYLCDHEAFMSNARLAFEDCIQRIDEEFLAKAREDMMSDGSTAAIVLIRGNQLMTTNLGDSRAVVSINGVALDVIEDLTPGRADERQRIELLGGWVNESTELQMSKLHSMDLSDPWIQERAVSGKVVRWVTIYRVNGELAVSRAIGDKDYRGQALRDYEHWQFPGGHGREFHGDLVISVPEIKEMEITPEMKFLVLACDGLWDTITSQEAIDHVTEQRALGRNARQISHSLAHLAIRLGSSDNVSVIVVMLNELE